VDNKKFVRLSRHHRAGLLHDPESRIPLRAEYSRDGEQFRINSAHSYRGTILNVQDPGG
jgi:hypothetical protein